MDIDKVRLKENTGTTIIDGMNCTMEERDTDVDPSSGSSVLDLIGIAHLTGFKASNTSTFLCLTILRET